MGNTARDTGRYVSETPVANQDVAVVPQGSYMEGVYVLSIAVRWEHCT